MAMLFITHDLGIVRKIADRVCVMTKGKIVETGPTEDDLRQPAARLHQHLLAAEPKGEPPAADAARQPVMTRQGHQGLVPDQARLLPPHGRPRQGGRRRRRHRARRPDARRRRRIRLGQDDARPRAAAADLVDRAHPFRRQATSTSCRFNAMRPLRSDMQIVFQDPFGSLCPRMSVADIVGEGLKVHVPQLSPDERDEKVVARAERGRPRSGDAPPLSARILRRPAPAHRHRPRHGARSRDSSCSTSRPRRST